MTTTDDSIFKMSEPAERGGATKYAFWLETEDVRLIRFTRSLICVSRVKMVAGDRALVSIMDSFDPDEAWHYIRTEVEEEAQYVYLDPMWEEALWL